jgi:hypothetical protein
MIKPVFRVVGLDQATCDSEYDGAETATQPIQLTLFRGDSVDADSNSKASCVSNLTDSVTLRLKDILPALNQAASNRLGWVRDFEDDPVVVSRDFYEVLLTYQSMKRAG